MKTYLEPLSELAEYRSLREKIKTGSGIYSLTGCIDAQKAHMVYGLSFDVPCTVVVTENELTAKAFYEDFRFYEPEAAVYPAKDLLFYTADLASNLLDKQRMNVLGNLTRKKKNAVILPAQALMEAVGYDLYCKLLSQAVKTAKGEKEKEDFETVVDLTLDAYVPDTYITDEFQKLDVYKRIAGIEDERDFNDMRMTVSGI